MKTPCWRSLRWNGSFPPQAVGWRRSCTVSAADDQPPAALKQMDRLLGKCKFSLVCLFAINISDIFRQALTPIPGEPPNRQNRKVNRTSRYPVGQG